jgi:hypothetical protein
VAPLFFLVFSMGYLAASLLMFMTNISEIEAYQLSSSAFVLTGLSHILLMIWSPSQKVMLTCLGLGLFSMGLCSTFTLVPIYQKMLKSLDEHFDFERVSRQEVIDKSSSLTVLIKSLAQTIAPILSCYVYERWGYKVLFSGFGAMCIVYGVMMYFVLRPVKRKMGVSTEKDMLSESSYHLKVV